MPKIYIPAVQEHREIDQIVAFGCSMTAGSEICDNLHFPDIADIEAYKKTMDPEKWFYLLKSQDRGPLQLLDQERLRAWPAHLGRLLDVPVINRALPGTGLEHQIIDLLQAYKHKQITDRTLVLWGFTGINRGILLRDRMDLPFITSYIMGLIHMQPPEITRKNRDLWYSVIHSDSMMMWRYYQQLSTIFDLAQNKFNHQFMFVQAQGINPDPKYWSTETKPPLINRGTNTPLEPQRKETREILEDFWSLNLDSRWRAYSMLDDWSQNNFFTWSHNRNQHLAYGHPSEQAHKDYAQVLYQRIQRSS